MNTQELILQLATQGQLSDDFDAKLITQIVKGEKEKYDFALFKAARGMMKSRGDYMIGTDELAKLLNVEHP